MTQTAADYAEAMTTEPPAPSGVTLGDALAGVIERTQHGRPIVEAIATGVPIIDDTGTGGLVRGEYCGIQSGPGAGKSTLADRIVLGALRSNPDATAAIFNLETSTPIRTARLLCGAAVRLGEHNEIKACLPLSALIRGTLEPGGIDYARRIADELRDEIGDRLRFVDDVSESGAIANLIQRERPDVVCIDHFGLVTFDLPGSSFGAVERFDNALAEIVRALQHANAAGIFIAEVTKVALQSKARDLSAVRGSARFASLAGQVLTLGRDADDCSDDPTLSLELWKNRHGRSLVRQTAQLFGGLAYLNLAGEVEPLTPRRASNGSGDE